MARNIDTDPILTLEDFEQYYKTNLDTEEKLEVERCILIAQDKMLAENNTNADLYTAWTDNTVSESDAVLLKKALRHLTRYYFEEGVDKQGSSVSVNVGSKNISRSQDGINFLPPTFYDLFAKTEYYTNDEFFDFEDIEDAAEDMTFTLASSKVASDRLINPDKGINPLLSQILTNEEQIALTNASVEQNEQDIATNTQNIGTITNTLENNVLGELVGENAGGTLTEGSWQTVNWTIENNSFSDITYMNGNFTFTQDKENVNYFIRGQSNNTGLNKEVAIRLWDVGNNTQFGNVIAQTINNSGVVEYNRLIKEVPAGEYRVEIFASTGGGDITFTNAQLVLFKFGLAGAVKSSNIVDDTATEPDKGINEKLIKIETNTTEITNNTNKIAEISTLTPLLSEGIDLTSLTANQEITLTEEIENFNELVIKMSGNLDATFFDHIETLYTELLNPSSGETDNNNNLITLGRVIDGTFQEEYTLIGSFGANKLFISGNSSNGFLVGIYGKGRKET